MGVLSGLEPKAVFAFFEDLCALPHGSRHTRPVSDYMVAFAQQRGLKYRRDEVNNVIIWKDAAPGYEDAPAVMLQGHMDMLVEKEHNCTRNTEEVGLDIFVAGDEIGARGTTLGADDGIGVAMALAVLDDDQLRHGPLECVFTVDEEVGMQGVRALDVSDLKARYMINLDSLEERVFTVSCAGSTRVVSTLPVKREPFEGTVCALMVDGLVGGHSGEDIHRGRANANHLMGRVLTELMDRTELRLLTVSGGAKDNTIPRDAAALIQVKDLAAAKAAAQALGPILESEYRAAESKVRVRLFLPVLRPQRGPDDERGGAGAGPDLFELRPGLYRGRRRGGPVHDPFQHQLPGGGDGPPSHGPDQGPGRHGHHPLLLFRLAVSAPIPSAGRDDRRLPHGVRHRAQDRGSARQFGVRHLLGEDPGPGLHLHRAGRHQRPHPPGAAQGGLHLAHLGVASGDPAAAQIREKPKRYGLFRQGPYLFLFFRPFVDIYTI